MRHHLPQKVLHSKGGSHKDTLLCTPLLWDTPIRAILAQSKIQQMCAIYSFISGAWARGNPQISGAYDPGYSSGDIPGHMPRISADIPGACSKSSNL